MEPNRREFQKQCAFQSFCKRVLHNEACNAHDEIRRRRKREVSFCDLALHEERQLYTVDKRRRQWVGLRENHAGVKFSWSYANSRSIKAPFIQKHTFEPF